MTNPDRPARGPVTWASFILMGGLSLCFAAQQVVVVHLGKPYDIYVALSGYGMKSGQLWELFTYQCLHLGWIHFLVTLAGLWCLGRGMERRLGSRRFVRLYFGAVLAGGVVQGLVALAGALLPPSLDPLGSVLSDRFGGPVVGGSVGLCAVWTAFCRLEPDRKVRLLFLLPVRLIYLWWMTLAIAILLVILPTNRDLAHLAHLTGLLAGLLFVQPQDSARPALRH